MRGPWPALALTTALALLASASPVSAGPGQLAPATGPVRTLPAATVEADVTRRLADLLIARPKGN